MIHAARGPLALAACAAVVLLVGCAALTAGPAGFGGGDGSATSCVPIPLGQQVLLGQVIVAPANNDVEIVGVTLDTPDGVDLERAYLTPVDDAAGDAGIGSALVPPVDPPPGWSHRVDAVGATVDRGTSGSIVVQVKHTGAGNAGFAAIHITYRSGGVQYEKSATTDYQLRESCF